MITLDGLFEGQDHNIGWHNVDAEFNEFAIAQLNEIGTLLFGRITYQMMASYWPTSEAVKNDPVVADLMNRLPKIVVSKTMAIAEWNNTSLIKDQIASEI
jgi:dihydrofolate reductase